jgi:hypothetical protein
MPVYQTTFEINAPASRVWQVLTGLERYAEWNPQIPTASGRLEVGGRIRLRLALPETNAGPLSDHRGGAARAAPNVAGPCCETVVLRGLPQVRDPAHRRWSHLGHVRRADVPAAHHIRPGQDTTSPTVRGAEQKQLSLRDLDSGRRGALASRERVDSSTNQAHSSECPLCRQSGRTLGARKALSLKLTTPGPSLSRLGTCQALDI